MAKRDHCTAAPDFRFGATCCKAHDDAYERGDPRAQADAALLACIASSGAPWRAVLYFAAVRACGWFFWRRKARRRAIRAASTEQSNAA